MVNVYDIAYAALGLVSAPVWLVKPSWRRKVLGALAGRTGNIQSRNDGRTGVMIHAVSVGEINATRELIRRLRLARPDQLHFIVSTTTETGFARGQELYGKHADITLVRYPLDFSWAIRRLLENLRPSVVVLMELEVWPNFLRQCWKRNVPVVVINGRLTSSSFARYRMIKPLISGMFRRIHRVCAQDENYARRFIELGAESNRVSVTGTMKFDNAEITDRVAGSSELAASVGLKEGREPFLVCGSTGPGEEQIILDVYRRLLSRFPQLRLILVPRKPERFDEAAELIAAAGFPCVRRSKPGEVNAAAVVLGDTMGELTRWYSLANLVFVGRSLVDLGPRQHGSDMIEPAALAKPVIVGPYTGNFAEPMEKFLAAEAMKVVQSGEELERVAAELLSDRARAAELGRRAREVVVKEKGATDRHVKAILDVISPVK